MVERFPAAVHVSEGGVAVFADAHLGQVERDAEDFLEILERLRLEGFRTVVLLGDIFHYFIGSPKFETPLVKRVVQRWRELAAAGLSLRYVEGNRDFFLAGTRFVEAFSAYGTTDGLEVGGRRYAFVHGDRVNTRDIPYRFWRLASKNPIAHALLIAIPGPLARSIVRKTEERLYRSNFKHKSKLPDEELLQEGRRARRAGYDEVLIGHFHVEKRLVAPDGVAHVLPAWLEERKHAEITSDGVLRVVEEPTSSRATRRGFGAIEAANA